MKKPFMRFRHGMWECWKKASDLHGWVVEVGLTPRDAYNGFKIRKNRLVSFVNPKTGERFT